MNYKLMVIAALGAALVGGAPLKAQARQGGTQGGDVSQQNIPSLEFQDSDVRDALRALFKVVGVSYEIDPAVQGTVTASLKNVKFETALRDILDQVKATWRVEGGVYQIIKREEVATGTGEGGGQNVPQTHHTPVRIYINHADPYLIVRMLSTTSVQISNNYPEMSTLMNSGGGGMGGGMGGGSGMGGGGFGGGGMGGGGMGGGGMGMGGGGMGMGGGGGGMGMGGGGGNRGGGGGRF